jgi:hypothetical protein
MTWSICASPAPGFKMIITMLTVHLIVYEYRLFMTPDAWQSISGIECSVAHNSGDGDAYSPAVQ